MSEALIRTPIELVRKWHALAERRRAYYVELYRSDRWRRYYSDAAFRAQMKAVIQNAETWAKVLEDMGEPKVARTGNLRAA